MHIELTLPTPTSIVESDNAGKAHMYGSDGPNLRLRLNSASDRVPDVDDDDDVDMSDECAVGLGVGRVRSLPD